MPVIPDCVPKFTIRPPCTLNDDGKPSDSIYNDVLRIFKFIDDERHLTAHDILLSVEKRITSWETKYCIVVDVPESNDVATSSHPNGINGSPNGQKNRFLPIKIWTNNNNNNNSNSNSNSNGKHVLNGQNNNTNEKNTSILKKLSKADKIIYAKEMKETLSVKKILHHKKDAIYKLEVRTVFCDFAIVWVVDFVTMCFCSISICFQENLIEIPIKFLQLLVSLQYFFLSKKYFPMKYFSIVVMSRRISISIIVPFVPFRIEHGTSVERSVI
jgi:hypothetical protein